jgi:phenylpyruvate tautomerase PptA (4-oxalocrotonate tautomerase family)
MPTYAVTTLEGRLSTQQKEAIAKEITRIHAEVTGAPSSFAQVLFYEVQDGSAFIGGAPAAGDQIFVQGQIRGGRTAQQKTSLIQQILDATSAAAQAPKFHIWVYIGDLAPGQMAEFGHILPRSGKEEEWMASLPSEDRERVIGIGWRGA